MKFADSLRGMLSRKKSDNRTKRPRRDAHWAGRAAIVQSLEPRTLLNGTVVAADDGTGGKHDEAVYGDSVLYNDMGNWGYEDGHMGETAELTASLVSGPSNGSLTLNPDGTFVYVPDPGFVGDDSFTYQASGAGTSDQATVYLTIWNNAPTFAPYTEYDDGPYDVPASSYLSSDGWVIGQLEAWDSDAGDVVTYQGSGSSYLSVLSDGRILVTDAAGLSSHFENGGGDITLQVSATDGVATIFSSFVLGKKNDWLDQSEIRVETVGGQVYTPADAAGLITALETIRNNGDTVSVLIIKGHGGPDGIGVGDGDEFLTTAGNDVYIGDDEVTDLLKDVTGVNTTIYLRGCFSYGVAKRTQARLDGATVYGAVRFVIGIPGTTWGIGVYN